jgi:hypothetical protein
MRDNARVYGNNANFGGGVAIPFNNSIFRITSGTVYGNNETGVDDKGNPLANIANQMGAALFKQTGTAEFGSFNGSQWQSAGIINTRNSTIKVVDGVLMEPPVGQSFTFDIPAFNNNAPIVQSIILSRSGLGEFGTKGSLIVNDWNEYYFIEWVYSGINLKSGSTQDAFTLELDSSDIRYNEFGSHNLTVIVWQGGVPYSRIVTFNVWD